MLDEGMIAYLWPVTPGVTAAVKLIQRVFKIFLTVGKDTPVHVNKAMAVCALLDLQSLHHICTEVKAILASEPNIARISAPAKVYGDLHGQFSDLLNFFHTYGAPFHSQGDIEYCEYVFVGDFVDRGPQSCELVCLLLALKVRYPKRVWLLRGNHETSSINKSKSLIFSCLFFFSFFFLVFRIISLYRRRRIFVSLPGLSSDF